MWNPDLPTHAGPLYRVFADVLARDISSGKLAPGTRLPTHRELADQLGVTVGTITRGYEEARRRGLVSGEVGRGTFVRGQQVTPFKFHRPDASHGSHIDLSVNHPTLGASEPLIRKLLVELAKHKSLLSLLDYQSCHGLERHRAAAVRWLELAGLKATPEEIVITSGAQHGLIVVLGTITEPGDLVLTEELSYGGIKTAARALRLRLAPVGMDEQGIRPDALESACRRGNAKALYCIPTAQNPTGRMMGEERRRELAAIARHYNVSVIEDDSYGPLVDGPPKPLVHHCPEIGYFVTALSKSIAPALRIGYVKGPASSMVNLAGTVMATTIMASPLCAELATQVLESGEHKKIIARQRTEVVARQKLARRAFGRHIVSSSSPLAPHVWVQLPDPWRAEEFVQAAADRGVLLTPSEVFVVGRTVAPHNVRVSLCAVPDLPTLDRGLRIVAGLLAQSGLPRGLRSGSARPAV
jgi:DNA-binding transcriptional MocR family regulator